MKTQDQNQWILWCSIALICLSNRAQAATRNWNGGTGSWTVPGNWTEGSVPSNGDTVVIGSGTALLASPSADLTSFTMSGGSLVFTNWTTKLSATNMIITGGIMTHEANSDTSAPWVPDARIWISCSNLFIASGASLNADAKGYGPACGPGGSISQGGASYAGRGSYVRASDYTDIPSTNGSTTAPENPGSGGSTSQGGRGGGAVRIDATGNVTVNGTITAKSGSSGYIYDGTGSGGAIYINCYTFQGTNGTVRANANNTPASGNRGGGGGGRIAVNYNTSAQAALPIPAVTFSSDGGAGSSGERYTARHGYIGTLYFPDARFILTNNISRLTGQLFIPGFSAWSLDSLTVGNSVWLRIVSPNLTLTITNDLLITDNAYFELGGDTHTAASQYPYTDSTSSPSLHVGGNLTVTNGGHFYIYSGWTGAATNYGSLVAVTGDVYVASNSWIHPYSHITDGGSPLFRAQNVTINAGGGFSGNGGGYRRQYGFGGYNDGGAGFFGAGFYRGGGGHGGYGGYYTGGEKGMTNDSANAPIYPGSGGGGGGGRGGGVVRMEVRRTLTLDGTISADGVGRYATYAGTGAGGSIYLRCRTFQGTNGLLQAKGANTGSSGNASGGGGGRIAVWRTYDKYSGVCSTNVQGGTGSTTPSVRDGLPGTVVWGAILLPRGIIITIR